ncbi:TetR/AcrR family transcriptional regulator [Micromonospora sp. STR1_7]|uniref:TetR/AcrR family transcriptional regulator n=1 Tax=Micromonospora parastrephiae TaxID=2806101 RepID=A0ABS1XQQ1_9ACTN|nr:TetR/AcrR family transcriptional regulator [Micromonospora parastrephiae]MBM0231584.1 TetR/AcrR family transcriptional regulator [Micromonospora parastrephiae]
MTETTTASDGQTRTARKRQAILDVASTLFLRDGYLATSMDQIAAAAAVSKQTVYKQFTDKQSLFREIVTGTVELVSDPVARQVASLPDSSDLEADLQKLARALVSQVSQPRVMQLRRLVIGEAGRFPELGRLFYQRGPGRTIDALAAAFESLAARNQLRLDDPQLAAEHFNWLVTSIPLNRMMLCGDTERPDPAALDRYADAGAQAFLASYRPN